MSESDLDYFNMPDDELPNEVEIIMPGGYVEHLDTLVEVFHDGNGNIHYFEQILFDEHADDYVYVQNVVVRGENGEFYALRYDDDIIFGTQYEFVRVQYDEEHKDFTYYEDVHTKKFSHQGGLSYDAKLQEVCVRLETGEKYTLEDLLVNNGIQFYDRPVEPPPIPTETVLPVPSVDTEKIPIFGRRARGDNVHYRLPFVESPRPPASTFVKESTNWGNYLRYLLIFTVISYLGFQLASGNIKLGDLINQVTGYGEVDDPVEVSQVIPTQIPTPIQQIVTTENCEMGSLKDSDGIVSPLGPADLGEVEEHM